MSPERAKRLLPIMQAFAEGAVIECDQGIPGNKNWIEIEDPVWDDGVEYRVKVEPAKSIGYRRYYRKTDQGIGLETMWEAGDPEMTEKRPDFYAWIDTNWQYDALPEPPVPVLEKTVPYKRFIAQFNGRKYVVLKYPDSHAPCHYVWHGTFVEWIDTDWQTNPVPQE